MSSPSTETAVCTVCFEQKPQADFLGTKSPTNCIHEPSTCLQCLTSYINSQIGEATVGLISCPECEEPLDYDTIRLLASRDLFNQ
ncbi:hypothetical protein GGR53DRAFT_514610 [Hypoxylon sp. FL1150]|nr:hypothetical protein GGR53DRAFT_514610 [Hypoxylon sp. FL1150]